MRSARRADPWTSWAAAKSVTDVSGAQAAVLYVLEIHGPVTLDALVDAYTEAHRCGADIPRQSASGVRTRCKELADAGHVRDTGRTALTTSGRQARLLESCVPSPRPVQESLL